MDAAQRSRRRRAVRRAERLEREEARDLALARAGRPWEGRWIFSHPRIALGLLVLAGVIAELTTGTVTQVAAAWRLWVFG